MDAAERTGGCRVVRETDSADRRPEPPPLKVLDREPDPESPWADDALDRGAVADRLTAIVGGQEVPFALSVDGRWGTGKTFLLKRWKQELATQGWEAIYYNAWEDDFAHDPLLAILSQLQGSLDRGRFRRVVGKIMKAGRPLLRPAASAALTAAVGVPLPSPRPGERPEAGFDAYREKREKKDELRRLLGQMAADVSEESGHPLVVVIDELDRCRPTFAIELLERVKHIFDVPNIVFVFGINRDELVKALQSVYGEIDAGTYLRRFFDMEFVLPEPDPRAFCEHLFARYGLEAFLAGHSERGSVNLPAATHVVPVLLGTMGLSLRDMDYCMRLLSLAARDAEADLAPTLELFVTLVALKIANQTLYRDFVSGAARAADVIDYIHTCRSSRDSVTSQGWHVEGSDMERVEAALYAADGGGSAEGQVNLLLGGRALTRPGVLAPHHRELNVETLGDKPKLEQLRNWMSSFEDRHPHAVLVELARTIDLHHGSVRR